MLAYPFFGSQQQPFFSDDAKNFLTVVCISDLNTILRKFYFDEAFQSFVFWFINCKERVL